MINSDLVSIVEINQEKMIWSHLQNDNKLQILRTYDQRTLLRYNLCYSSNRIFTWRNIY